MDIFSKIKIKRPLAIRRVVTQESGEAKCVLIARSFNQAAWNLLAPITGEANTGT